MYRNIRLAVFYHVACMGPWQQVDGEIVTALQNSGILDHADSFVRNECADVSLFEFPTIDMLRQHAATDDCAILYLHTKGVSKGGPSIDDWRACMLYWMVERWRECVCKLIDGYDAVGITRKEGPLPHYQGNFWWSKASYVRTLNDPRTLKFVPQVANQGERHKCEFWILSKPGKFYQPYNHNVRPYSERNPRSRYEGKAF